MRLFRRSEDEGLERPKPHVLGYGTIGRLLRTPLASFGFFVLVVFVVCAIFAPWVAPHDPLIQYSGHYLEGPSKTFLLGTDQIGRDALSRIIYGLRISLVVGVASVGLGTAVGSIIGLVSAYARGWVDATLMRMIDAIATFPSLIIAFGIVAALGAALVNLIIAIGIANIPYVARLVRSQALSVRERDFVMAAEAVGTGHVRMIWRHIWPNCTAPVIVHATMGMAYAVMAEASLSFLGVGIPPPAASLGRELRFAYKFLDTVPLLSIAPGVAIFLLVLALNFVGDALRDVLDPRLRGLIK